MTSSALTFRLEPYLSATYHRKPTSFFSRSAMGMMLLAAAALVLALAAAAAVVATAVVGVVVLAMALAACMSSDVLPALAPLVGVPAPEEEPALALASGTSEPLAAVGDKAAAAGDLASPAGWWIAVLEVMMSRSGLSACCCCCCCCCLGRCG